RADVVELGERAGLRSCFDLRRIEVGDRVECVRERLDAMRGFERAVEQEDDAVEGVDRLHGYAGFTVNGIDVQPRSRKLCVPTISPLGSNADVCSNSPSAVT